MIDHRFVGRTRVRAEQWLTQYYFIRAVFSVIWVCLAFSVGMHSTLGAAFLLVIYPAWDAFANYLDLSRSGGKADNASQAVNVAISAATATAVILLLKTDPRWLLCVFAVWAILSGLLQLVAALRRRQKIGAQWVMVLSGAQSALAGAFFLLNAPAPLLLAISKIGGYAGVGAVYFLISSLWLSIGQFRRNRAKPS